MEKRIALELRGKAPSEVKELNLDNCRSMNIVGLSDEYKSLKVLSLNSVGLTSLKGFPALPALKRLELSDNRICGGLNVLSSAPELTNLNLSGNRIKELEELRPLQELKNLRSLDLFNNEVTSLEDYRNKMFALLPNLKYLDGADANDCEGDESDEEEMNGNNDSDESGEEEDDESGDGMSLSAVYNDNLEEESSASSLFEGSDVEEEEDDEDGEGDEDADESGSKKGKNDSTQQNDSKDGEARGKKRKAEEPAD